tara:strand:+ start:251 stop:427 length:177 start_codon:yes stop_codon:yes gene_type:complete
MRYNTTFTTDSVSLITTVDAEDEGDALSAGLARVLDDLGLNLIPIRCQVDIEQVFEDA